MAQSISSPLLLFLLLLLTISIAAADTNSSSAAQSFVESSCKNATYPSACVKFLSPYAAVIGGDLRKLAQTALVVSHRKASTMLSFLSKLQRFKGQMTDPAYTGAVSDCLKEMADGVSRLRDSITELRRYENPKESDFKMHMSNVQTWVSGALTEVDTCADGFSSGALNSNVKESLKRVVTDVSQVTSDALGFVNRCADSS